MERYFWNLSNKVSREVSHPSFLPNSFWSSYPLSLGAFSNVWLPSLLFQCRLLITLGKWKCYPQPGTPCACLPHIHSACLPPITKAITSSMQGAPRRILPPTRGVSLALDPGYLQHHGHLPIPMECEAVLGHWQQAQMETLPRVISHSSTESPVGQRESPHCPQPTTMTDLRIYARVVLPSFPVTVSTILHFCSLESCFKITYILTFDSGFAFWWIQTNVSALVLFSQLLKTI